MDIQSPNFAFLADLDPILMHQAALAERYCLEDPSATLSKLRLYGELLAKNIAARFGVYTDAQTQQAEILKEQKFRDVLDSKLAEMFHSIRIAGNAAVHEGKGTVRDALQNLRFAHQLAVYFYRVFKDPEFKSGPFQVPPNPANVTDALQNELQCRSKSDTRVARAGQRTQNRLTKAENRKTERS
jgi:type I restriction enzyme, R subunit